MYIIRKILKLNYEYLIDFIPILENDSSSKNQNICYIITKAICKLIITKNSNFSLVFSKMFEIFLSSYTLNKKLNKYKKEFIGYALKFLRNYKHLRYINDEGTNNNNNNNDYRLRDKLY